MRQHKYDVIIVGGGLNGLCSASLLGKLGYSICLIEKKDIRNFICKKIDGRGIALSRGSKDILEKYQLWGNIHKKAGLIEKIKVQDSTSPFFLKFDNELLDSNPLGYIIEMSDLIEHFYQLVSTMQNVVLVDNQQIRYIEHSANSVDVITNNAIFHGSLVIAADGKNSYISNLLNIKYLEHNYSQVATVYNVWHELPHNNTAFELFYKNGPCALLPLKDHNYSSVVWIENSMNKYIMQKDNITFFSDVMNERFMESHGKLAIASEVYHYPISLKLSKSYYAGRVVLIGDNLHYLHPITGQGFNLSLRDISKLVELISKFSSLGLDIGTASLFDEFKRSRIFDNCSMAVITDGLNRLFSNNNFLISLTRNIGLEYVNNVPILQRFFMNYAMGKNKNVHHS
jgi:2-octaprenyl-6-methoxyphenol hydroxylase